MQTETILAGLSETSLQALGAKGLASLRQDITDMSVLDALSEDDKLQVLADLLSAVDYKGLNLDPDISSLSNALIARMSRVKLVEIYEIKLAKAALQINQSLYANILNTQRVLMTLSPDQMHTLQSSLVLDVNISSEIKLKLRQNVYTGVMELTRTTREQANIVLLEILGKTPESELQQAVIAEINDPSDNVSRLENSLNQVKNKLSNSQLRSMMNTMETLYARSTSN